MPTPLTSRALNIQGDLEDAIGYCYEAGWTDGLPIIPPTEDRVARMVAGTARRPDEIIARVAPAPGAATVEKIAINAVMAGCGPEHLPVLIAAVAAMAEPDFNLGGIQTTTNPAGVALILNGPVRTALNVNCGRNCMGPGRRSNAVLGRAVRLVMINIGGGRPPAIDMASHGFPGKYTFCFGENEEESPWEPFHVERGFSDADSTVTVVGATGTTNCGIANFLTLENKLLIIAEALSFPATNDMKIGKGNPTIVVPTYLAQMAKSAGMSKAEVKAFLYQHAGRRPSQIPETIRLEQSTMIDGVIKPCLIPDDIILLVAGGSEPNHVEYIPTFGDSRSITKRIDM